MRVAIIGGGVAGLVAARTLAGRADIALFETHDHLGGDAYSLDLEHGGRQFPVETGFVVYAARTYPRFQALLDELGVENQPTRMSFSVRCDQSGIEIASHTIHAVQLAHVFSREPYQILYDALRFRRHARRHLHNPELTLGEYLEMGGYSRAFQDYVLLPPCAAGWCTDYDTVRGYPFARWYRFMEGHGLGSVRDAPTWYVVKGGTSRYVERLAAPFAQAVRLRTPVKRLERRQGAVWVVTGNGEPERFDQAIVATHADQALAMLAEPTEYERRVLGAFQYSDNSMCLHSDPVVLPRNKHLWSSWNYYLEEPQSQLIKISYLMNSLFRFECERSFLLTANRDDVINPELVVKRFRAQHPRFTKAVFAVQPELAAISGAQLIHYCGAYFGFGIHEDAVVSGEAAARAVLARA